MAEPLNFHQIGWKTSVNCHFQVSLQMLCMVQVWALVGLLQDRDVHEATPLLSCLRHCCAEK